MYRLRTKEELLATGLWRDDHNGGLDADFRSHSSIQSMSSEMFNLPLSQAQIQDVFKNGPTYINGWRWNQEMFTENNLSKDMLDLHVKLLTEYGDLVLPDNWDTLFDEEALSWLKNKEEELGQEKEAKEHIRVVAEQIMAPDSKPTNPKDLVGSNKVPLGLFPDSAIALGSVAMLEGELKYGRQNFRDMSVRASIYYDAFRRHSALWFDGEDADPDSGLPHLAHALACLAIIIDAEYSGKLIDDRSYNGGAIRKLMNFLTPFVGKMREKYADRKPKHWSIQDNEV